MKFLLFFAFVAICSAQTPYGNKKIVVTDDGTILITGTTGKRFIINKQFNLQKNIDIVITKPNMQMKRIQINDQFCDITDNNDVFLHKDVINIIEGKTQVDHLLEVLEDYQGYNNDFRYNDLLNQIERKVKKGEICQTVFDLLCHLDQIQDDDMVDKNIMVNNNKFGGGLLWELRKNDLMNQIENNQMVGNYRGNNGFYGRTTGLYNQLNLLNYLQMINKMGVNTYGPQYGNYDVNTLKRNLLHDKLHNVQYASDESIDSIKNYEEKNFLKNYLLGVRRMSEANLVNQDLYGGKRSGYGQSNWLRNNNIY